MGWLWHSNGESAAKTEAELDGIPGRPQRDNECSEDEGCCADFRSTRFWDILCMSCLMTCAVP
ncbi:hypothetical protein BR93DRAFT_926319 [Coniochaeta sp. PMI_546]|nr:hypothetical protein BR93DRAFT_926319 [Coniochaeta sp. PMI_546]